MPPPYPTQSAATGSTGGESSAAPGRIAPWAVYLAVSWTWVIGMVLPVLMIRDYGPWGFVVFAVPNILGAAAMGRTIPSALDSRRFVNAHKPAATLFSIVTIAFHGFVIGWLSLQTGMPHFVAAFAVLAFSAWALLRKRLVSETALAWLAAAVSLAIAIILLSRGDLSLLSTLRSGPSLPSFDLLALAPICIFGFALCPYLDLTFHRARQALDGRPAAVAFALGFGGPFAMMILFTVAYAPLLPVWPRDPGAAIPTVATALILTHLALQSAITCCLHANAAREVTGPAAPASSLAALVVAMLLGAASAGLPAYRGMLAGEVGYRTFMGAYGLAFPAYVVFMGRRSPAAGLRWRSSRSALTLAIGLAVPFFWLGFVERIEPWLIVGLALLALVWTATERRRA